LSCVLCKLCWQFLWIVHFWLPLWYSLTFIYSILLISSLFCYLLKNRSWFFVCVKRNYHNHLRNTNMKWILLKVDHTVINILSTSFVLILENHPIRTSHPINTANNWTILECENGTRTRKFYEQYETWSNIQNPYFCMQTMFGSSLSPLFTLFVLDC